MMYQDLDHLQKKHYLQKSSSFWHWLFIFACPVLYFYSLWSLVFTSRDYASILGISYSIIISGLLSHEAIHNSLFRSSIYNYYYGELMSLINGAFFVSFKYLSQQHIQHHINNVGYDGFSLVEWVKSLDPWQKQIVITLESFYIPILSYIAAWRAVLLPLVMEKYQHLRQRIYLSLLFRAVFFGTMWYIRPISPLLYLVSINFIILLTLL